MPEREYAVGWTTLALINAGLAAVFVDEVPPRCARTG